MNEFKLIVAGGRDFRDMAVLSYELAKLCEEGDLKDKGVSIVSGMAPGADMMAVQFAHYHHVKVYKFPADWNGPHKKGAGFVRNRQMAEFSDGLLAFWDGKSKGTQHMINTMKAHNKPVWVINY